MNIFLDAFRNYLRNLTNFSLKNRWLILAADLVLCICGFFLTVLLHNRYQSHDLVRFDVIFLFTLYLVYCYLIFFLFQSYRGLIRHLQFQEMGKLGLSLLIPNLALYITILISGIHLQFPVFFVLNLYLLNFILMLFMRFWILYLYTFASSYSGKKQRNTFIYGIGSHSVALMQWVSKSASQDYNVQGFVMRNHGVKKTHIQNVPVFNLAYENVYREIFRKEITVVLFPDYMAMREEQEFITVCLEKGMTVLVAPPFEGVDNTGHLRLQMKPIQFEDLLGREEIMINMDVISEQIENKVVLVTGAAGSIASELVRQLILFKPSMLILFDCAETPLHHLQLELEQKNPDMKYVPVIGDVRNPNRLDFVFRKYKPTFVYHAAAYKHVPLMENNPSEAVICNVLGTKNLADFSIKYGIERFVMISTDKAVNPTNIMGASKRIAEIYVQSLARDSAKKGNKTIFVTTRFGNVLGSNGSVIPHFKSQIEKGGPVTVTHPDIIRYFMTIPEACRLVLEAGSFGKTGEIYVFDMGKPVKIVDLAKRMIEMAGLVPDRDIDIEFIGLREGEKLYEELLSSNENMLPTVHEKIMVASVRKYDFAYVSDAIDKLIALSNSIDIQEMVKAMKKLVPEFKSNNSPFELLDGPGVYRSQIASRGMGLSIRCLKD